MNVYKTDYRLNEKTQQLCEKLYLATKKSKTRRFHQLYDKVYRMDILHDSWNIVKQNKGCAGVDGMKISDVILYGQDKYLQELHELLLDTHKYHPRKIKRVYIPKADGKEGFDFLGFHHRQSMSKRYRKRYTLKFPKKEAVKKLKQKVKEILGSRATLKLSMTEVIKLVNPILRGWMNYFRFGNSNRVFNRIDSYVHERLALWWSKKHQKRGRGWKINLTWEKFSQSGITLMTGKVRYWSETLNE